MQPVDLLVHLLGLYSPSDKEAEAVKFLVEWMRLAGFDSWVDEVGNAVGVMGGGADEVVLLGHIDTVPGFIPVKSDGDRVYGRGAVDAKGPLAAFAAAVAQCSAVAGRRFVVIGAVAEEGDSKGARYVVENYGPRAVRMPVADRRCLIIGEPSGWERVTLGYKGSMWVDYRVEHSVGHTAAQAQSACEAAVQFWIAVMAHAEQYNAGQGAERVFDSLTPTLRGMWSDSDGFRETARLHLGLRLPPDLAVEQVYQRLLELGADGQVALSEGAVPAYRGEKNTPLVRAFLAAIRASQGNPAFTVKTGTSDMNIVAPRWHCHALAYGPGDSALDHTPDEHLETAQYLKAIEVLARVLCAPTLFWVEQHRE